MTVNKTAIIRSGQGVRFSPSELRGLPGYGRAVSKVEKTTALLIAQRCRSAGDRNRAPGAQSNRKPHITRPMSETRVRVLLFEPPVAGSFTKTRLFPRRGRSFVESQRAYLRKTVNVKHLLKYGDGTNARRNGVDAVSQFLNVRVRPAPVAYFVYRRESRRPGVEFGTAFVIVDHRLASRRLVVIGNNGCRQADYRRSAVDPRLPPSPTAPRARQPNAKTTRRRHWRRQTEQE